MTIQDIGSIGEVIGAVATVATLAYLAMQIRRSNILSTAESKRFARNATSETILSIVRDPDVARLWREGLSDRGALNTDDKVRFDMLLGEYISGISAGLMDQVLLGDQDAFHASESQENIRVFLQTPGGTAWWEKFRGRYEPRVRSAIDEILSASELPAAQQK